MLDEAAKGKAEARAIREICSKDVLFYISVFLYTFRPQDYGSERYVPFVPYPGQVALILEAEKAIREGYPVIYFKAREQGMTELLMAVYHKMWTFMRDIVLGVSSKREIDVDSAEQPMALLQRFDRFTARLPSFLQPKAEPTARTGGGGMRLNNDNGSMIKGSSTTKDMFRSDRCTSILCDEFATVENGQAVIAGITDSCPSGAIFYCSTPQAGANGFNYALDKGIGKIITYHWWNHPDKVKGLYTSVGGERHILDDTFAGEILLPEKGDVVRYQFPGNYPYVLDGEYRSPAYDRKEREKGSKKWMQQEWGCVRYGVGDRYYDLRVLEAHEHDYAQDPWARGELQFSFDYDRRIVRFKQFEPGGLGRLLLWTMLDAVGQPARNHAYALGCDVAYGTGASNSVCAILDVNLRQFVAEWVCPNTSPEDFARVAVALAKWCGGEPRALLLWDGNGPGLMFGREVQKLRYSRVYRKKNEQALNAATSKTPGYFTGHGDAKNILLGEFRGSLGRGEYTVRSAEVLREAKEYIWLPSGDIAPAALSEDSSGARTAHGDRVIAYALACVGALDIRPLRVDAVAPEPGSWEWRRRQVLELEQKANPWHRE